MFCSYFCTVSQKATAIAIAEAKALKSWTQYRPEDQDFSFLDCDVDMDSLQDLSFDIGYVDDGSGSIVPEPKWTLNEGRFDFDDDSVSDHSDVWHGISPPNDPFVSAQIGFYSGPRPVSTWQENNSQWNLQDLQNRSRYARPHQSHASMHSVEAPLQMQPASLASSSQDLTPEYPLELGGFVPVFRLPPPSSELTKPLNNY